MDLICDGSTNAKLIARLAKILMFHQKAINNIEEER